LPQRQRDRAKKDDVKKPGGRQDGTTGKRKRWPGWLQNSQKHFGEGWVKQGNLCDDRKRDPCFLKQERFSKNQTALEI